MGNYILSINDRTMEYSFTQAGGNQPPVASFTSTVNGLSVSFDNTSTDPDDDELTYSWNFGNGMTSAEKSPDVTYEAAGKYTVTLKVTDSAGNTDTHTQDVTVTVPGKYAKVALRGSHNNYGTDLLAKSGRASEWEGTFEFSDTTKFKLEALPLSRDQCIFLGGSAGEALTASGGFITLPAGNYIISFNEETRVLSVTDAHPDCDSDSDGCVPDPCAENPSLCEEDPCEKDPSQCASDTRKYCDTD